MKFFKPSLIPVFVVAVLCIAFFPPLAACKKDTVTKTITDTVTKTITDTVTRTINDTAYYDAVCPLRGSYSGSNLSHTGATSPIYYTFQDDNLAVGKSSAGGPDGTFGGYKNTCDSVILSVYYPANSSYYTLLGKISNSGNTISGAFNNLTDPSDYGTFTMSK